MSFDTLKTMTIPDVMLGHDGRKHTHTSPQYRRLRNRSWEATCTCGVRVTAPTKEYAVNALTLRPCTP